MAEDPNTDGASMDIAEDATHAASEDTAMDADIDTEPMDMDRAQEEDKQGTCV